MALNLKKILITDEVDPKCVDILQRNGLEVVKNTALAKDIPLLIAEIPKYDGLIVRSATRVTADIINAATNLKIIGRAGTGVDNIDFDAATKKGVIVMNTPGGNTMSAAEHTCTMLLAMSRHVSNGTESLRAGRWDRKKFMGNEVLGKTLAIIGLGRIGKEVATRMQAFGMTTIGFDPIIPGSVSAEFGVEWMSLDEVWKKADYITVHTPLIPQTKNLLCDETFAKCKKGVRVINCARGGIIDEDALLRALQSGQCGGAALDVFLEEPPTSAALVQHPLVTSTPHLGASTVEAQSRVAEEIAEQFVDARDGKSLFGALNAQALSNALSPSTRPWVDLGCALGKLAVIMGGKVTKESQIKVITQGPGMKKAGSYLSAAALMGMLKAQTQNGLNLVSAPALGKELGIQVAAEYVEGTSDSLSLVMQSPGGAAMQLSGEVGADQPLLKGINGAQFAQGVSLRGNILLYCSQGNGGTLAAVAAALTAASNQVLSFSTSAPTNSKTWALMHLANPIQSLDAVKQHVEFVQCVSL